MSQIDTRQEILKLAGGYLQRLGFNGFSFQNIADDLGIKKASIHYYFQSKEEMGLALIERYSQLFQRWSEKLGEGASAAARIKAYFEIFEFYIRDHSKICPIGVLSSDFNTLPTKMKRKLCEFQSEHKAWIAEVLQHGRASGEFAKSIKVDEVADVIVSSVQGAVQISRIRGDGTPIKNLQKFILRSLVSNP